MDMTNISRIVFLLLQNFRVITEKRLKSATVVPLYGFYWQSQKPTTQPVDLGNTEIFAKLTIIMAKGF